jgi:hypothetical protein
LGEKIDGHDIKNRPKMMAHDEVFELIAGYFGVGFWRKEVISYLKNALKFENFSPIRH